MSDTLRDERLIVGLQKRYTHRLLRSIQRPVSAFIKAEFLRMGNEITEACFTASVLKAGDHVLVIALMRDGWGWEVEGHRVCVQGEDQGEEALGEATAGALNDVCNYLGALRILQASEGWLELVIRLERLPVAEEMH